MYIEYLSFFNLLIIFVKNYQKEISLKNKKIYYFDNTFISKLIIYLLNLFFNFKFEKIKFRLIEIKDEKNELIRLRIFRKDLIQLQKNIIDNNIIFKKIKNDKKLNIYYEYLIKSLVDGHLVMDPNSLVRAVFIIQVALWHAKQNNITDKTFLIGNRIWFNDLKNYALNNSVNLIKIPQIISFHKKRNFYFFHIGRNNYPILFYFYVIIKKIIKFKNPFVKLKVKNSKIYSLSQGHFNMFNNGMNSDLFYFFNSHINSNDIICEYKDINKINKLKSKNFSIINEKIIILNNYFFPKKKYIFSDNNLNKLEYKFLSKNLKEYNLTKKSTSIFSRSNNIKIYLTWEKYIKNHIANYEAISELNGIFAVWQYAFEGTINSNTQMHADIYFSNYSKDHFFNHNSKIQYFVNTGFVMDYKFNLLKEKAQILRNKLLANGAKYIVSVFDENSNQYERWHTGHELQAENYAIILEELLKNKNIGVIFKPKNARTLRERIGKVTDTLNEAVKTGRCFIYDQFTENFTSAPPILAGLSSDMCIHSHLCAGTAAIECALANLPTILIDREGSPQNMLYNLKKENIIFYNWKDAINAIKHNFEKNTKNNNLGKWPNEFLNSLDNFRDGKAAHRMGQYLNTMIKLIKENKSKEEVMNISADIYSKKYGIDKISSIN